MSHHDPPRLAWSTPIGPVFDAFSRLRVSTPATLFDSKQLHGKKPLFWDELVTNVSGNATSTHSTVDASTSMYVESGDTIVRQTKTRWNYQPGKSQLGVFTGNLTTETNLTGVVARIGLFDENDGVYFEGDSTTIYCCVRKNGVVTSRIPQSQWNMDKFNGKCASKATLDPTKCQILFIDYEWLGVGRIRYGFFVDGVPTICHQVEHFNALDSVYMSTPNLPVRYEISSTGSAATLQHICSTVMSEGGLDERGVVHTASTSTAVSSLTGTGATIYGLIGVRLRSTHLDLMAIPKQVSMNATTANDQFELLLLLNPTVAGSPTFAGLTNSGMETVIGTSSNTVTADSWDLHMAGSFASSSSAFSDVVNTEVHWGSTIGGVSDEIWLCVRPLQNMSAAATMSWLEYV